MSTVKHIAFRKVLSIEKQVLIQGELTIKATIVLWCIPKAITSRTVKTEHLMFSVYVNGRKHCGTYGWMPHKAVSINLKNPFSSKFFTDHLLKYSRNEAYSEAFKDYIGTLKGLTGIVRRFDRISGEGMIYCKQTGEVYPIYACNLKGAKTCYPETACVYLNKGDSVDFKLTYDLVVGIPGIFDEEKWNKLDQTKLAFKMDANGNFLNGLFE